MTTLHWYASHLPTQYASGTGHHISMATENKKDVIVIHTFDTVHGKRTTIYDHSKFPRSILERIRELPHEVSWREVGFADARCSSVVSETRTLELERAQLSDNDEIPAEIPPHYTVRMTVSYPGRYRDICRRFVRVTCTFQAGRDTVEYYHESALPVAVLSLIRDESVTDMSYSEVFYGDVSEGAEDGADRTRAYALRVAQLKAALFQGRVETSGRDKDVIVSSLKFAMTDV